MDEKAPQGMPLGRGEATSVSWPDKKTHDARVRGRGDRQGEGNEWDRIKVRREGEQIEAIYGTYGAAENN